MQLASAFACLLHCLRNRRILFEPVRGNERIDARDVHLHNSPSADIQMAHFAVAHLPVGQADKMLRRANERVRKFAQQFVVSGLARYCNGIVGGFSSITPSVKNGEDKRVF